MAVKRDKIPKNKINFFLNTNPLSLVEEDSNKIEQTKKNGFVEFRKCPGDYCCLEDLAIQELPFFHQENIVEMIKAGGKIGATFDLTQKERILPQVDSMRYRVPYMIILLD